MSIAIELEREDDGRWLAEVPFSEAMLSAFHVAVSVPVPTHSDLNGNDTFS
jgi:hypothetical protein